MNREDWLFLGEITITLLVALLLAVPLVMGLLALAQGVW